MAERNKNGTFSQGNSIAVKKWTLEEMEIVIENYFETCNKNILIVRGEKMSEPYTVEGLALALDLTMQGLWNYETAEGYEPFFETIKKAKLRIQGQKVLNGLIGRSNPVITIFDLKNNHGYKDKTEVDQTLTSVQPLQFKIIGKD